MTAGSPQVQRLLWITRVGEHMNVASPQELVCASRRGLTRAAGCA